MDERIRKLNTRIRNKEAEINALYTKIQKLEEDIAALHRRIIYKKLETAEISLTGRPRSDLRSGGGGRER